MIDLNLLPDDIKNYIKQIHYSRVIQKYYRSYMLRHCRHKKWIQLRKKILCYSKDIDCLTKIVWVRCEWRNEPESWLYMLYNTPEDLFTIINEIKSDFYNMNTK